MAVVVIAANTMVTTPTLKRWGFCMGHTTISWISFLAVSRPAMSAQLMLAPWSSTSLHTCSTMCGSCRCSASGSSPSRPGGWCVWCKALSTHFHTYIRASPGCGQKRGPPGQVLLLQLCFREGPARQIWWRQGLSVQTAVQSRHVHPPSLLGMLSYCCQVGSLPGRKHKPALRWPRALARPFLLVAGAAPPLGMLESAALPSMALAVRNPPEAT